MKLIYTLLVALVLSLPTYAQTAVLRGQVVDESGAVVPGAEVTATASGGAVQTTKSGADGGYSFTSLQPGVYSVKVNAPDLTQSLPAKIMLKAGPQTLNLQMKVASTKQEVTVQESAGPALSTESSSNASALVIQGKDLEALSDDPDDLQQDLQALAGPSAGPSGGEIYIDGFSGGQLPSKESIREVRINQNPFSPEYDKLGYGRIEVFTKPGTDKIHGQGSFHFGDDAFDSRNPFAQTKAPFRDDEYQASVGGPLNKRASYFFDFEDRAIQNGLVIDAVTVSPTTPSLIAPFSQTLGAPQNRLRVSPRLDYQLTKNNTLTARYAYTRNNVEDSGIGGFNLVSRGYRSLTGNDLVQITDTAVLAPTTINETRFQYFRTTNNLFPNDSDPAVMVLGSFNGGGGQVGRSYSTENDYEIQNYTSINKGAHSWKFGARLRGSTIDNVSLQNFGGTFTFGGGLLPFGDPNATLVSSIVQYQNVLAGMPGWTPTQFTYTNGNPLIAVNQFDAGLFVGDDWRVKPNLTLSMGLRYETQTNIQDHGDLAPRFGFAWAPGSAKASARPKLVIRGGFGIFYDRFALSNILTAERFNGIVQQQFTIDNPTFFLNNIPQSPTGALSATYVLDSKLRAPYLMQSAISVERQLPRNTTLAVTYTNSHGLHILRSNDINAPLNYVPGQVVPSPIFEMQSTGLYNQNQMIVNINSRMNANVSLFGFYTLNYARSNTDGLTTYPSNPYSMAGEYGPAATDIRNRAFLGGSVNTKWNVRLSPFVMLMSGPPFDITTGEDLYGTTLLTARPGILPSDSKPGLIYTSYGWLDPNPSPGEPILPRNYGRGPGSVTVNLRLSKTFGFGSEREGAGRNGGGAGGPGGGGHAGGPFGMHGMFGDVPTSKRYNLTLSINARNALNHVNVGPITGNITSPLFGLPNSLASGFGAFAQPSNNRRIDLQARLTF